MIQLERYSSKDTIIINNPPLQTGNATHITDQILVVLIKAWIIPWLRTQWKPVIPWVIGKVLPPAVIVKFIYYNDKIELYNRRPILANLRNPLNGKPVNIEERLPQHDLAIQKRANELDLVTTTYNCRVERFLKTENGRLTQPVDSVKAVEDLESRAMEKISPYQRNQANNWNPNQVPNQRGNKWSGGVIENDKFNDIYHMGATPAGKKLNDTDTPPNRWLSKP